MNLAVLGPVAQELFDSLIWPLVLQEAAKVSDPALQAALVGIEPSIKALIDAEIAKL